MWKYGGFETRQNIPVEDAIDAFERIRTVGDPSFCFESRSLNSLYGRMSILGIDPPLEIYGKGNIVRLTARTLGEFVFRIVSPFWNSGKCGRRDFAKHN